MKLCKQAKRHLSVQHRPGSRCRWGATVHRRHHRVGWVLSKIGFSVAFTYCDPPFYGQVERGGGRLNLRRVGEPVFVDGIRERLRCRRWGLPPSIARCSLSTATVVPASSSV